MIGRSSRGRASESFFASRNTWSTSGLVAGVGGAMTLRSTSPQAAKVVISASFNSSTVAKVRFDDPVELKILSGGDAHGVIRIWVRQPSHARYCGAVKTPPGNLVANHQNVLLARLSLIPVVLLVNAVEFKKFVIVSRKALCRFICQSLMDGAGQKRISLFQTFIS